MNVDGPASYFLNYGWGRPWGWTPFPDSDGLKPLIYLLLLELSINIIIITKRMINNMPQVFKLRDKL